MKYLSLTDSDVTEPASDFDHEASLNLLRSPDRKVTRGH